ncbi:MAG: hypothetical protein H0V80_16025 [Acidobacteria bacterium]|nr:hypothetical protein [Acidobacteriota bacterium]
MGSNRGRHGWPYSAQVLGKHAPFDLDHFVPWSFLVHDEFWNLIPADPTVNSMKRQQLPHRIYVSLVAATHFQALGVLRRELKSRPFDHLADGYMLGLNIDRDLITATGPAARAAFTSAFEKTLFPLLDLAHAHGFQGPWLHS